MPGSAENISEPENSQDAELDANPLDLVRQRLSRFVGLRGSGGLRAAPGVAAL